MNLPNKLSLLRICMVPVFVALLLYDFVPWHFLWALLLFAAAAYTDHLDGVIARKRSLITSFGKFLDPLADKVLVVSALLCFVQMGLCNLWLLFIVLLREFAVTSVRLVAVEGGQVIAANRWGKAKTVSQICAVLYMLAVLTLRGFGVLQGAGWPFMLGEVLLWVSCALTVISGVIYVVENRGAITASK